MPPAATTEQAVYFKPATHKAMKATKAVKGTPHYAQETDGPGAITFTGPLKASGVLDAKFRSEDIITIIGREYKDAQLSDILKGKGLLRDLAITVSRRGVVFFRNQILTVDEPKDVAHDLGEAVGKPETSSLQIHPITTAGGF